MDLPLTLEPTSSRRAQLERQLRDGIRSGRLRPGAPLPPSRALADQLGVSRGIVVDAYSQLVAEGYLTARRGSGTRVADTIGAQSARPRAAVERTPRSAMTCAAAFPTSPAFPRRTWQAATASRDARAARRVAALRASRAVSAACAWRSRTTSPVRAPPWPSRAGSSICTGISHGMTMIWRALRERGAQPHRGGGPGWPSTGRQRALRRARAGADPGGRARPRGVGARGRRASTPSSLHPATSTRPAWSWRRSGALS